MNFKSYKKFYFHCLANAEFKPDTKVLKNLFLNMTLKEHIWPQYYHHILAADKLRSIDWDKTESVLYYNNAINLRYRDWDQVQYLWTGMALKEFFFRMFIFQWIQYSNVLFVFWLKSRPSIKYARNWGNGWGHPKCIQVLAVGREFKNRS